MDWTKEPQRMLQRAAESQLTDRLALDNSYAPPAALRNLVDAAEDFLISVGAPSTPEGLTLRTRLFEASQALRRPSLFLADADRDGR